ncbi:hypothetical protein D9613_002448 [Agrocybe pediades]|uniref:Major facilitator superfamily (MFS) profile domain-containing protein n=1 Tax=Agrocybe pediades TaxID=84607 RepID=A0A8H4QPM2_9AGAR|nr:hypothetical protein D9613_002448 [Agrocybe pediades]
MYLSLRFPSNFFLPGLCSQHDLGISSAAFHHTAKVPNMTSSTQNCKVTDDPKPGSNDIMAIDNPPNHNHGTSEKDTTPPPPLPVVSPGHRNQDTSVLDLGDEEEVEYPDGGLKAWLVVVGIRIRELVGRNVVEELESFCDYALVFLPGLVVGRLFDIGHNKSIFITSSIILVVATFLVAECNKYWHFLLCQGIVVESSKHVARRTSHVARLWRSLRAYDGYSISLVQETLWDRHRVGGGRICIGWDSPPYRGFKWTLRIFGFILLTILTVSNLLLKRRLPPRKLEGGILNLRAFTNAAYAVYCLAAFVTFLGIYTLLTYVGVSASQIGISSNFAFYLFAFANASSLAGRLCAGRVSDRFGPMNVMVPFTAVAGILTYAWPFADTESSLIAVTVLYGFCTGAYVTLTTNPIIAMEEMHDVGRRTGMFISVLALGSLAGPPISGAINADTGGFKVVGYYAELESYTYLLFVGASADALYLIGGLRDSEHGPSGHSVNGDFPASSSRPLIWKAMTHADGRYVLK